MAYTTHGFPYPTNTGLVKDGATNFNDLATTVDTKMGLYYITQVTATPGAANVIIDNVFTTTYENYKIVVRYATATTGWPAVHFYMRAAGIDSNTNIYYWMGNGRNASNADASLGNAALTYGYAGNMTGTFVLDVTNPKLGYQTLIQGQTTFYNGSDFYTRTIGNWHNSANAYDGIKFFLSASTFANFVVRIYGYNQA